MIDVINESKIRLVEKWNVQMSLITGPLQVIIIHQLGWERSAITPQL